MSAQPDPARDEPGTTPETMGAPSHIADAAESAAVGRRPRRKALACLPAALSMMSISRCSRWVGLALCLVIVAVLIL